MKNTGKIIGLIIGLIIFGFLALGSLIAFGWYAALSLPDQASEIQINSKLET